MTGYENLTPEERTRIDELVNRTEEPDEFERFAAEHAAYEVGDGTSTPKNWRQWATED